MKISVNDQELLTLSNTQKKVIMNDIHEDEFDEDMKRRIHYILMHKYERCYERLIKEWVPRLESSGAKSIPLNRDELAEMIFLHPEYKGRKDRGELSN